MLLLNVLEKMTSTEVAKFKSTHNLKVPCEKVLMSLIIKFYSHNWCLVSGTPDIISLSVLPYGHQGKDVELICQVQGASRAIYSILWALEGAGVCCFYMSKFLLW